jgi:hypothetical protein
MTIAQQITDLTTQSTAASTAATTYTGSPTAANATALALALAPLFNRAGLLALTLDLPNGALAIQQQTVSNLQNNPAGNTSVGIVPSFQASVAIPNLNVLMTNGGTPDKFLSQGR